jgi:hypothetical protein
MALPANLAQFDGFIDLVVEALVREIRNPIDTKTNAATPRPRKARRSKDLDDAELTTIERAIAT